MNRIIGDYGKGNERLLICTAGMHGNEPEGVYALQRVFEYLENFSLQKFHGRFIGIRGNIKALKEGKRYLKQDLNRVFSEENVSNVRRKITNDHPELKELEDIIETVESIGISKYSQKYFLDLHATSGENGIFLITPFDEIPSHSDLISRLNSPKILNISSLLKDTSVPFMKHHGFYSFGFEGGKIGNMTTVQNHIALVWQVLAKAGFLAEKFEPHEVKEYKALESFAQGLPSYLRLTYRHSIKEEDEFRMIQGFENFSYVKKGDLLAFDKKGEVLAPQEGYLLMPLYQKTGSDGFFMAVSVLQNAF
jgi:succinylglutamate desuccinylase